MPIKLDGATVGYGVSNILKDVLLPLLVEYYEQGGRASYLEYKFGGDGFYIVRFDGTRVPCEQQLLVILSDL